MRCARICTLVLGASILVSSLSPTSTLASNLVSNDYTEINDSFDNPERGFYVPAFLKLRESGSTVPYDQLKHNLIHLRIDISDFGKDDCEISNDALDALDKTLKEVKKNGGTVIVRFAYDSYFNGQTVVEPDIVTIGNHIKALSKVLEDNEPVIACVETGILGQFGEIHGSDACTLENRVSVIQYWLDNLSDKFIISVRTPTHIAEWAGVTIDELCDKGSSKKGIDRVGIFNDGYLGSGSDLGTYRNREKEIDFLESKTENTFFGGEMVAYYDKDTPRNTAKYMSVEGFKTHTQYLNIQWNNNAIDALKSEVYSEENSVYDGVSGFQFVETHLGYRYVLNSSDLEVDSNNLHVYFRINNVGFGNMINDKEASLILTNDDNTYELPLKDLDIRGCLSQYRLQYESDISLDNIVVGDYDVSLRISEYGDYKNDNNYNCVRFANVESRWNEKFGSNYLGSISVSDKLVVEPTTTPVKSTSIPVEPSSAPLETTKPISIVSPTYSPIASPATVDKSKSPDVKKIVKDGKTYSVSKNKLVLKKVSNKKSVVIPSSVKYKGKIYNVSKINKNAFKSCKSTKEVFLFCKVPTLNNDTFKGCKKLERVTLTDSIETIKSKAFRGTSLEKILYLGTTSDFRKIRATSLRGIEVVTVDSIFNV